MTQNQEPIISITDTKKPLKLKLPLKKPVVLKIVVALVIIIVVLIAVLIITKKPNNTKVTATAVCTLPANIGTLKQAAIYINTYNYKGLGQEVSKIQSLTNYTSDPNCLYVLLTYSLDLGNTSGAITYFNELEKVYNPEQGYSRVFTNPTSIATLKVDISTIKIQNKEAEQNGMGLPPKDLVN